MSIKVIKILELIICAYNLLYPESRVRIRAKAKKHCVEMTGILCF